MSKASKNLILVEGKNEVYVFGHLFHHHGIQKGIIDFKSKDGIDNLLDTLPVELRGSELERLGIVVDADANLKSRLNHQIKAHIHTWLAWQAEPGTPLGLAITKRYLDADAAHAKKLIDWIRRLFNL